MKEPYKVIQTVMITEKGTVLSVDQNKYTFKVAPDANKIDVRAAIQAIFNVKVSAVNIMNREGKLKRLRSAHFGRRTGYKKAIVTVSEGKIDIM